MMQTLRNNTKWIMLATALAFVALMVFQWGMDLTGRSGSQFSGGEIGRVNGEPILYEEFNAVYRNIYDQQQQFSKEPVGNAMQRQIEDAAWDQVLMQHLISQELKRRGIVVTDDEVRAAARYEPPPEFRNDPMFKGPDGQFDITRYHQYLSSAAVSPELLVQLEAYYRDAIPRSKLFYQQTAGFYVPDDQLWQIWRDTHDAVTIRYVAFDPATLVSDASVTITDPELHDYYVKNRDSFVSPTQATVKYVALDRRPDAADSAATLARVREVRAELAGGADFAEVATRESADSVSAANGGLLTIHKGETAPSFEEAAFSQPIGRIGEPVLTQFGYHIVQTESRAADSATVRHILIPVSLTTDHEDSLLDQVDSLECPDAVARHRRHRPGHGAGGTRGPADPRSLVPGGCRVGRGRHVLGAERGETGRGERSIRNAHQLLRRAAHRPEGRACPDGGRGPRDRARGRACAEEAGAGS